jgi:hypothetical protein
LLQRLPVITPKSYAKREKREFNYIFLKTRRRAIGQNATRQQRYKKTAGHT